MKSNPHLNRTHEELANSLTHGTGLLLSVIGFIILLSIAIARRDPMAIVASGIYGVSMLVLYLSSTLYHASHNPQHKHTLRMFDHLAIYLFIAGSYTPFLLLTLGGGLGWTMFAILWTIALSGAAMKIFKSRKSSALSTASYLGMGWISVIVIWPLYKNLPLTGFALLVVGGIAYSAGVYFFARDHHRFRHAIWHVFVMVGSICHYLAILFFVIRPN